MHFGLGPAAIDDALEHRSGLGELALHAQDSGAIGVAVEAVEVLADGSLCQRACAGEVALLDRVDELSLDHAPIVGRGLDGFGQHLVGLGLVARLAIDLLLHQQLLHRLQPGAFDLEQLARDRVVDPDQRELILEELVVGCLRGRLLERLDRLVALLVDHVRLGQGERDAGVKLESLAQGLELVQDLLVRAGLVAQSLLQLIHPREFRDDRVGRLRRVVENLEGGQPALGLLVARVQAQGLLIETDRGVEVLKLPLEFREREDRRDRTGLDLKNAIERVARKAGLVSLHGDLGREQEGLGVGAVGLAVVLLEQSRRLLDFFGRVGDERVLSVHQQHPRVVGADSARGSGTQILGLVKGRGLLGAVGHQLPGPQAPEGLLHKGRVALREEHLAVLADGQVGQLGDLLELLGREGVVVTLLRELREHQHVHRAVGLGAKADADQFLRAGHARGPVQHVLAHHDLADHDVREGQRHRLGLRDCPVEQGFVAIQEVLRDLVDLRLRRRGRDPLAGLRKVKLHLRHQRAGVVGAVGQESVDHLLDLRDQLVGIFGTAHRRAIRVRAVHLHQRQQRLPVVGIGLDGGLQVGDRSLTHLGIGARARAVPAGVGDAPIPAQLLPLARGFALKGAQPRVRLVGEVRPRAIVIAGAAQRGQLHVQELLVVRRLLRLHRRKLAYRGGVLDELLLVLELVLRRELLHRLDPLAQVRGVGLLLVHRLGVERHCVLHVARRRAFVAGLHQVRRGVAHQRVGGVRHPRDSDQQDRGQTDHELRIHLRGHATLQWPSPPTARKATLACTWAVLIVLWLPIFPADDSSDLAPPPPRGHRPRQPHRTPSPDYARTPSFVRTVALATSAHNFKRDPVASRSPRRAWHGWRSCSLSWLCQGCDPAHSLTRHFRRLGECAPFHILPGRHAPHDLRQQFVEQASGLLAQLRL